MKGNRSENVKTSRGLKINIIAGVFSVLITIIIIYFSASVISDFIINAENRLTVAEAHAGSLPNREDQLQSAQNDEWQNKYSVLTYVELITVSDNRLLLVNGDHEANLIENSLGLVKVIDYAKTLNVDLLMNEEALIMLNKMLNDAKKIGYDGFRVTEGYRTREYQKELYENAADKAFVARPGHSEHETGLAVDISYGGVNIANSKQGQWLAENSYKYGFILRYPKNKEEITGIPHEPWHFRYVGEEHARYIFENGLCLEEYIEEIKIRSEIAISAGGADYTVYYLSGAGESVKIPEGRSYRASLDNTGGIVVSVK